MKFNFKRLQNEINERLLNEALEIDAFLTTYKIFLNAAKYIFSKQEIKKINSNHSDYTKRY